jgi:hypothetical protein
MESNALLTGAATCSSIRVLGAFEGSEAPSRKPLKLKVNETGEDRPDVTHRFFWSFQKLVILRQNAPLHAFPALDEFVIVVTSVIPPFDLKFIPLFRSLGLSHLHILEFIV